MESGYEFIITRPPEFPPLNNIFLQSGAALTAVPLLFAYRRLLVTPRNGKPSSAS